MTWQDTKQQKAVLRQSKTARKVRAMYPQGTRVGSTPDMGETFLMSGTVYRHIPQTNAQGGVVIVDWDNGIRGRIGPINIRPLKEES